MNGGELGRGVSGALSGNPLYAGPKVLRRRTEAVVGPVRGVEVPSRRVAGGGALAGGSE